MQPSILLLTGPSGAGKTTICLRLAALARDAGLAVAGVVSQPADPLDCRDVIDAASGQRRRLAEMGGLLAGPSLGPWRFSAEALAWGAGLLLASEGCDLLIVDEIGPLELQRGEGWIAALDVLQAGRYGLAVVVVRPGLADALRGRLAALPVEDLAVTPETRDALPRTIVARLGGAT